MKKLKIVIQEQALVDLEQIWLYTFETWSLEQADRYYDLIIKEINFLATRPSYGKSQAHLRKGYFSTQMKSHIIFYKHTDLEIQIIRILHENMDIPNRLNE